MPERADLILAFIANSGWTDAERTLVAGDASNRRYERLSRDGATVILMDAPPSKGEDVRPFIKIAKHLRDVGLSAPEILSSDEENGLLIIEDLGDDIFARLLEDDPGLEPELYTAAADVLLHLHKAKPLALPNYDADTMTPLAALAFDWYQMGASGSVSGKEVFVSVMHKALSTLDTTEPVLIQRDYHAENLLWLPNRSGVKRVGLLDFQDAMLGHPAYDLVSILQDARRDVSVQTEADTLAYYIAQSGSDVATFEAAYALLGVQRNLRILGVFARLSMAYGKPRYIDFIPRVWDYIQRMLNRPDMAKVRDALKPLPEPDEATLDRLRAQCGNHPIP
jgi:aminoglycoside/choline kinase family phosphotransferase